MKKLNSVIKGGNMKKTFFLVILSITCSILLVGCGFDSVSPTAEPTVARELFFDDAGAGY